LQKSRNSKQPIEIHQKQKKHSVNKKTQKKEIRRISEEIQSFVI
jgi:hypothetical protein